MRATVAAGVVISVPICLVGHNVYNLANYAKIWKNDFEKFTVLNTGRQADSDSTAALCK